MGKQVTRVIAILAEAKKDCEHELAQNEDLRLRVSSTLQKLMGRLNHIGGAGIPNDGIEKKAPVPMTHVLGIPVSGAKKVNPAKEAEPTAIEKKQVDELTETAIRELPTLPTMDAKQRFGDLVLRGVGVKLGLPVTATEPEKVDAAFVKQLQEKIKANEAAIKSEEQALAEIDKIVKQAEQPATAAAQPEKVDAAPATPPQQAQA